MNCENCVGVINIGNSVTNKNEPVSGYSNDTVADGNNCVTNINEPRHQNDHLVDKNKAKYYSKQYNVENGWVMFVHWFRFFLCVSYFANLVTGDNDKRKSYQW